MLLRTLSGPYEKDRVTIQVGVAEDARPFMGSNFQATLRDLESRMRDEIKRLKLLDLQFANEAMTSDNEQADPSLPKRERATARADAMARMRKARRR